MTALAHMEDAVTPPMRPTRILVLAPTGRDAETTVDILCRAGFSCARCATAEELCRGIEEGAAVAVVTAEALTQSAVRCIAATLASQPPWSEIPIMIFVAHPEMDRAARTFDGLGERAHVTLVDRPIHVKSLVSVTRAAVRSRMRQYEIRDLLAEQQKLLDHERSAAMRLSGLAEASLAIASAVSLGDVLQMITDQSLKVIPSDFALIWMQESEHVPGAVRATSNRRNEDVDAIARNALEVIAGKITSTVRIGGEALRNVGGESTFMRAANVMAAPIQEREGATIGVLLLGEKASSPFTTDDEAVLTQLAQMASAAVQNARLYREAQDANRAKDDFLATLAHELRTPMTGVLGWVQMLKADAIATEGDAALAIQMIENSTRVQARLVEDLLDVSRIIAGKLRVDMAPVELAPVVETVVETFRARAAESGVTIDVTLEEKPLSVYGDETRLHQVLWNLLSNAIKFTAAGGRVHVTLGCERSRAMLRVEDTGRGISPEFLPLVFERFRQADNTTTRTEAGLGLGLAIVRHLVQLHAGDVTVTSPGLGQGTTFTITLPVLAVRVEPERIGELHRQPDLARLDGVAVLVVDDDAETGNLVVMVLNELGAETRAVTSVNAAVKELRSFPADVVVSDIAMPGEDGYALMHRLREIRPESGAQPRTMALTGYGRPEDRSRILASGFQKYIQKPVEPAALARAIAELVRT